MGVDSKADAVCRAGDPLRVNQKLVSLSHWCGFVAGNLIHSNQWEADEVIVVLNFHGTIQELVVLFASLTFKFKQF